MIIVGYQGIGKSSLAGTIFTGRLNEYTVCIDLESSNFFIDGDRDDNWYKIYANIADNLSKQGFVVMTSSHKAFREELKSRGIKFITVSPSVNLKNYWIKKLRDHYETTSSGKDYKALMNAVDNFEENVEDLQEEEFSFILSNELYQLQHVVRTLLKEEGNG